MSVKFNNISKLDLRNNILTKRIEAKLFEFEEKQDQKGNKYGKFLLMQGRSKIIALAYGKTYTDVKDVLKTGPVIKFPSETFSCKLRNKKYNSNSTCTYDLTFLPWSAYITKVKSTTSTTEVNTADHNFCSLREVAQLQRTSNSFNRKLKSIKFSCGEVYRYLGCKNCSFSIPRKHTDGKYYCKGICNNKQTTTTNKRSNIGVETERKICIIVYEVKLSDDRNEAIDSVVIFNSVCESLFNKSGSDFYSDNEAVIAWKTLISHHTYDLSIKRKKKKRGSIYAPTVFVDSIDNLTGFAVSNCMNSEPDLKYSYDDGENENRSDRHLVSNVKYNNDANSGDENEKENDSMTSDVLPYFHQFEMKLQPISEHYKKRALIYRIASKPPGLVLLINNYNFPYFPKKEGRIRKGSEKDMSLIETGFREMGFEIYGNKCHLDVKTREDFRKLRDDFKKELVYKNADSSFIVISSHGINFQVCLTGQTMENACVMNEMLIPFSDANFPEFQGKPKVFIPMACQNFGTFNIIRDSLNFKGSQLFDIMICFPCLPGYKQRRYREHGSLFTNYLMYNLMRYATTCHFLEILEKVQEDIYEQIKKNQTKITPPYWIISVFRRLYLVPRADSSGEYYSDIEEVEGN